MAELTLVPDADYRDDLVLKLRKAAIKECRDAVNSLASGTLEAAGMSVIAAQEHIRYAQKVGTSRT